MSAIISKKGEKEYDGGPKHRPNKSVYSCPTYTMLEEHAGKWLKINNLKRVGFPLYFLGYCGFFNSAYEERRTSTNLVNNEGRYDKLTRPDADKYLLYLGLMGPVNIRFSKIYEFR